MTPTARSPVARDINVSQTSKKRIPIALEGGRQDEQSKKKF